jgi:hypothetical protein
VARWIIVLLLMLPSCGVALEDGLATPPDEWCVEGITCAGEQLCVRGACFDPCLTDETCGGGVCCMASDGKAYCAPWGTC